jgi:hypothetical protein
MLWDKRRSRQLDEELDRAAAGEPPRNTGRLSALVQTGTRFLHLIHRLGTPRPRPEFQDELRARLLAARTQTARMSAPVTSSWRTARAAALQRIGSVFSGRRYAYATSALVLVAVVTTTLFGSFRGDSFLAGFSRLVIPTAYALENFELVPEHDDSLGVDPNGAYILTSKAPLDDALIRENLTVTPSVPVTITALSDTSWRVAPTSPLPAGTVVRMTLATSTVDDAGSRRERDYAWAFQVSDAFRVLATVPRDRATNVPVNAGIEVVFSSDRVPAEEFQKHFSILPAVPGRFERHGRTMVYVPTQELAYGTVYTVSVMKGFGPVDSDRVLAEHVQFQFETQRQQKEYGGYFSVNPTADASTLEAPEVQVYTDSAQLEVDVYAFKGVDAYLAALRERDAKPWWSGARADFRVQVDGLAQAASFTATTSSQGYAQTLRFPGKLPSGWYVVQLTRGDNETRQLFLQVTDLAVYANATKTRTVVWVNDLAAKAPVRNASVEVVGMGSLATTVADGTATFSTPAEFDPAKSREDNRAWYGIVRSAGRAAVVQLAGTDYGFFNYYGASALAGDDYWHYLSTDRPRYQPTDTVRVFGVLRERGSLLVPEKAELVLIKDGYVDYWYEPITIARQEVTFDRMGGYQAEFGLDRLKADYYTLELRVRGEAVERRSLWVEPYAKPAYTLGLEVDRPILFPGESASALATAAFFEGTPLPNLQLSSNQLEPGVQTTDAGGRAAFTYTAPEATNFGGQYNFVEVNVRPVAGESANIVGTSAIRVYPARVYVRSNATYPEKGVAEVEAFVRQVDRAGLLAGANADWGQDYDGKVPAAGARVGVKVTKRTTLRVETGTWYDFVSKRTYKSYRYNQQKEVVDAHDAVADENGRVVTRLAVQPDTSYTVELSAYDQDGRAAKSSQWLWYYDGRSLQTTNGMDRPYYHLTDTQEGNVSGGGSPVYAPGQQVGMRFLNNEEVLPASTAPSFLYLQLQNGLQEVTTSTSPDYQFPFERRDIPNVTVTGVWFSGSAYVTADYGANYDQRLARLSVEVQPNKSAYAPGADASLAIRVTDAEGRPVSADVNVKVVDEAYYAVAQDDSAPEALYNGVGPGTWFVTYTHRPVADGFGGAEKGGGGGGPGAYRSDFKDVALFTVVRTGSDGRGTATLKLPDNVTTWRVTSQAISGELGYGKSVAKLPVTKPAFVDPVAPREVLAADRPVVALRAYGTALKESDEVQLTVDAPFLGQTAARTVHPFERANVDFGNVPVGTHQVGYRMKSGRLEDGVRLPLTSVISRLSARDVLLEAAATTDFRLPDAQGQTLEVVLADAGQNAWYLPLAGVANGYGGRPDQIAAGRKARTLLSGFYNESEGSVADQAKALEDGGFSAVQWGGSDVALTAMLADVAGDQLDEVSLRQYFFAQAEEKGVSAHQVAEALHGLASLGDPVLLAAQSLLASRVAELDPADRLAVALAMERMGDGESARKLYVEVMGASAVTSDGQVAVRMDGASETTRATAMALLLASRLDMPEVGGLRAYVTQSGKGYPSALEIAGAAAADLPRLAAVPAAAEIAYGDRTERLEFTGAKARTVHVPAQVAADFRVTKVEGDVQVIVAAERAMTDDELGSAPGLSVERRYAVDGALTSEFHEGDLVEVRLYPKFAAADTDRLFEIVDLLPSGLRASVWTDGTAYSKCQVWPSVEGQRVRASVFGNRVGCAYVSYYARVRGLGSFRAEPAVLQSVEDTARRAHSASQDVLVR